MPRAHLIRCDTHPYHVTSRCHNKGFFPLPMKEVWEIMAQQLLMAHKEKRLAIHAFILMGNHFHLLCHTPAANLDEAMHALLRASSYHILRRTQSPSPLWEGRYKWSLIDNQSYYYQVYRYIYQNPIRAGITERVEDYPWSTLKTQVPFPLHTSIPMSFGGEEGELVWLNERFDQGDLELIKLGLRKSQFDVARKRLKAFSRLSLPE